MKSDSLSLYKDFLATATAEQINFVDSVYALAEANYVRGGDVVVECMTPEEVLAAFKKIEDVHAYCGLRLEQAANCRWGDDTDPELKALEEFKEWREE